MQQIFDQLIKGFVPKIGKQYRKYVAQLREKNRQLLRELKGACPDDVFRKICEVKRMNLEYCREDLKDMFSEGVLYGIQAGLEAACGFPEGRSFLAAMLYGQLADIRHRMSSEKARALMRRYDSLYRAAKKQLTAEQLLKLNDMIDNDAADAYSYTEAYYADGMRKGIPLGMAAGELAKTLPLG